MRRIPVVLGMTALGLVILVGAGAGEDAKKETKKDGEKPIKGSVPIGWKALKLSKDQTKKVQTIDVEYKTKIAELNRKIDELKEQSRIEMIKTLTNEQRALLAKLSGLEPKEKEKDKSPSKEKEKDK